MTSTETAETAETAAPAARAVPTLASVAGVVVTVLVAGGFALGVHVQNLHNGLLAAAFAAVGLFVLHHRPGNREAWLFVAGGVAQAVLFFGRQYGLFADAHPAVDLPAVEWVTWIGVWPLPLVMALVGMTIMSFPDGRLPEPRRRWRLVVAVMLALGAGLAVVSALWPVEYTENSLPVDHPLHIGGAATARDLWSWVGPPVYLGFQLAWLACVVTRLRRAGPDEVQQVKWFASGLALASAVMVVGLIAFGSATAGVLATPLIPATAGAAILRYRLYDIDLVVNKTLVVGTMAALVSAAYVGVVVGIGDLLGVADGSDLPLSLVATACVAVAFDPVRRRVQRWADRLVHGNRPTPYEALARLSSQLGQAGEHEALFAGLASTVADGVGAVEATLWVGPASELVAVASWPPPPAGEQRLAAVPTELEALGRRPRTHVRPIVHQGRFRGAVSLTKAPGVVLTTAEGRLLGDLAAQAGLVIDNVGLGVELEDRLHQIAGHAAELRAAAQRIVAAQDEARRRIERDLHDGAQQRLVTLALGLQSLAQRAGERGDAELAADAEAARRELLDALAELREMARGIHPTILVEEGLEAALAFLAERSTVPVDIDVQLAGGRRSPPVEATAYFVVSEALTNTARHAAARTVTVTVRGAADAADGRERLAIEIVDDGQGGADGRWAGGLQGLTDRLATLDGTLTVDSPPGRGTRLRAEIPCG